MEKLPSTQIDFIKTLDIDQKENILRLNSIFKSDKTLLSNYVDELMKNEGKAIDPLKSNSLSMDNVRNLALPEEISKYEALGYATKLFGKGAARYYDTVNEESPFFKDEKRKTEANKKMAEDFRATKFSKSIFTRVPIGFVVGAMDVAGGVSESIAALSDLALDTDTLASVQKAIPRINLDEVYGDKDGASAKFTALLVQFGTGFGLARKISEKVINKLAEKKLTQKVATKLAATKTGKKVSDLAKFGGYWVLPAAAGDMLVSRTGQKTLGDAFGNAEGNFLERALDSTITEDVENLTGSERAAAVLRNKLKFGAEGTAILGSLKLVGPAVKLGAYASKPLLVGTGKGVDFISKALVSEVKIGNRTYGIPSAIRYFDRASDQVMNKLGIPKFEFWKFEQVTGFNSGSIRKGLDILGNQVLSGGRFDKASINAKRNFAGKILKAKKGADIFMKDLDNEMYKLANLGFSDIAFNSQTRMAALSKWNDILSYMRGEIKLDALPKAFRFSAEKIRKMIDDQTKELAPYVTDRDLRGELIKNMGKYLHTSYEIFKGNGFRPDKEVIDKAVTYFNNLLKKTNPELSPQELLTKSKLKVDEILRIGSSEGSTPIQRINEITKITTPDGILKDKVNVPAEIAALMGKVTDPKNIIMDTIVEQAKAVETLKMLRTIKEAGMGKWIFKNEDEYVKYVTARGVKNAKSLVPIEVKQPYNLDLKGVFQNADGSSFVTIPEMASALKQDTLLTDMFIKNPIYKGLLAIKAGTQINKTVLSVMTQMRNITTASAFALANGHIGSGGSMLDNFKYLFDDVIGQTKDPQKLKEILDEALEVGALDSSVVANEIKELIPEIMTKANSGFFKTSDQFLKFLYDNPIVRKATEFYQLGDNVWKVFGYNFTKSQLKPAFQSIEDASIYLREIEDMAFDFFKPGALNKISSDEIVKYIKTPASKIPKEIREVVQYARGEIDLDKVPSIYKQGLKTTNDAIKEVSGMIMRDTYPNYSMIPKIVQEIRRFPFIGNFVGFTSEMYRNTYHIARLGLKQMSSSNPYVRQMGARRFLGGSLTIGGMTPTLVASASTATGIAMDKIKAFQNYFTADYEKGSTFMPVTGQDPKDKSWYQVNLSYQNPYDAVAKPFVAAAQNWELTGKVTDKTLFNQFVASIFGTENAPGFLGTALKPFIDPAIWAETSLDIIRGTDKDNRVIYDFEKDRDPFSKIFEHIYNKVVPTTLLSTEKIVQGTMGRVSPSAVKFDPVREVLALVLGIRIQKADPKKSFEYQNSMLAKGRGEARSRFLKNALNADKLMIDPTNVQKEFDNYLNNDYREWSKTYDRIQSLRVIGFNDVEIMGMLGYQSGMKGGRRAYSKKEIKYLMQGYYIPREAPTAAENKISGFKSTVDRINQELGTKYTLFELLNPVELEATRRKYTLLPLKIKEGEERERLGDIPVSQRMKEMPPETVPIKPEPIVPDTQTTAPGPQSAAPMPDQNLLASTNNFGQKFNLQGLTPSGLTRTEEAFLSPTEKLIAQRGRGIS
jgi:hypothetical protein